MRFEQALRPEDEALFHAHKLREMVLSGNAQAGYALTLWLQDMGAAAEAEEEGRSAPQRRPRGAKLTGPPPLAPSSIPDGATGVTGAAGAAGVDAAAASAMPADVSGGVLPDFVKVQPLQ